MPSKPSPRRQTSLANKTSLARKTSLSKSTSSDASSKEAATRAFLRTFRDYGFDGASLKRLSEASGLGRSSLYHHFPKGKDDMAIAAATLAVEEMIAGVIEPLQEAGPVQIRLGRAIAGLDQFYDGGDAACLVDLFSIGEAAIAAPAVSRTMVEALVDAFAKLAVDAGIGKADAKKRAQVAGVEIQGGLVVARALGDRAPFQLALKRLPELLLA